jgi:hypothetical protein
MMSGPRPASEAEILDWLRTHVRIEHACRVWAGTLTDDGLPLVRWRRKGWLARRLFITLTHGPMRTDERVWATCGTEGCMAPKHLKVGSQGDMNRWLAAHGHYVTGARRSLMTAIARAPGARLSVRNRADVFAARAAGEPFAAIAARYGVSTSAVQHYVTRWRSLATGGV